MQGIKKGFSKEAAMKILIFLLLSITISGQQNFMADIDSAYSNARKGMFWAFSHIPESKKSISKSIISDNSQLAKIKLTKEVQGVKVVTTGYHKGAEVSFTVYKSYENLLKEGYIRKEDLDFIR